MITRSTPSICAVAIVKGDERFIEEWIVYHRFIGVDRFMIYDNSPGLPLRSLLSPYRHFVTIIDWRGDPTAAWPGRNLQTKTYAHALAAAMSQYDWVTFIDVDEFIVLRQHANLAAFLSRFEDFGSVRLNWHVFGHNGYYEDPNGLITSALTRRMAKPSPRTKAISRPESVFAIESAHLCRLKAGWRAADANARPYTDDLYPGKTDVAHINHYACRSFLSWMGRVARGDVSFDRANVPAEHAWRLDPHLCLRQFVETVAKDKNELVDEYMLRYRRHILDRLAPASRDRTPGLGSPRLELADLHAVIDGPPAIALRPQPARGWIFRKISGMRSALRARRLLLRLRHGGAGR
jgi:hypothetical protein